MAEALNLVKGSGIELTKNDADNTLTISATGGGSTGLQYIICYESVSGTIVYPDSFEAEIMIFNKEQSGMYGGGAKLSLFVKTSLYSTTDKTTGVTTQTGTYTYVVGEASYSTISYSKASNSSTITWTNTQRT